MKTPLVALNLLHQPVRTATAILGVAFAVLLIFMQLGFYGSAEMSATRLYDALDFDLLLRSRDYLCLTSARPFPRYRLQEVLGHAEVTAAAPIYISWQLWRIPAEDRGIKYYADHDYRHYRRAILVLAFNLQDAVFRPLPHGEPPGPNSLRKLATPNTVLVDTYTRKYFGKHSQGVQAELSGAAVTVEGQFTIGTGLGADGLLIMSDRTYTRLAGAAALDQPTLGLIKLQPQARSRAAAIKEELHQSLDAGRSDVEVLTRKEVERRELDYWLKRTPVGVIFTLGVLVACLVGIIFVYQVIATDIADHAAEYATLRAIGYSTRYLSGVVLRQALAFALLGYTPGLLAALLLYWLGQRYEQILLFPSWERAAAVLLLAIAMCSLSGLLAVHKVKAVDPADQF
jgi:putative ABC transport system permease protein